jgi:ureidoacrylate peracid hydrolase
MITKTTEKQALILVDLQNAFCSPYGSYQKRGFSIIGLEEIINKIEKILSIAHQNKLMVIFTRIQYNYDYSNSGLLVKEMAPHIVTFSGYKKDSWDSEIYSFINREKSDIVVNKTRYDPFIRTRLKSILNKKAINQIFIAGLLTNVCVESTVRSAFDYDYKVNVISDATSTYSRVAYNQSLLNIKRHFGRIITSDKFKSLIELY